VKISSLISIEDETLDTDFHLDAEDGYEYAAQAEFDAPEQPQTPSRGTSNNTNDLVLTILTLCRPLWLEQLVSVVRWWSRCAIDSSWSQLW
jgi:hypothetical protein